MVEAWWKHGGHGRLYDSKCQERIIDDKNDKLIHKLTHAITLVLPLERAEVGNLEPRWALSGASGHSIAIDSRGDVGDLILLYFCTRGN